MSYYNQREKPFPYEIKGNPDYIKNKFILEWWTNKHDELLYDQVINVGWEWYRGIWEKIVEITTNEVLEHWKKEDPLCHKYAWYNILMYFAVSKAEHLGYTKLIKKPRFMSKPEWKRCPLCNNKFIENSLPPALIRRTGIDQIDFCAPCLRDTMLFPGIEDVSKNEILDYIRALTNLIQRIPPQNYGNGIYDIYNFSTEQRLSILNLLKKKPAKKRFKEEFDSWFNALIEAGVLDNDAQQLSRGTRCLANDGHICLSLGEKTIDDLLDSMDIKHEKEPKYPEGNYRADFKVNDSFIEYFGLKGQPDYDKKIEAKKRICKKYNIQLLPIYPKNLMNIKTLERKILEL